jgi:hypothetical protein
LKINMNDKQDALVICILELKNRIKYEIVLVDKWCGTWPLIKKMLFQ